MNTHAESMGWVEFELAEGGYVWIDPDQVSAVGFDTTAVTVVHLKSGNRFLVKPSGDEVLGMLRSYL